MIWNMFKGAWISVWEIIWADAHTSIKATLKVKGEAEQVACVWIFQSDQHPVYHSPNMEDYNISHPLFHCILFGSILKEHLLNIEITFEP